MDWASFAALFAQYGNLLVFATVFLDNAGLPLPGELALLAFGFAARTEGSIVWGLSAASLGAMAGDTLSYWIGRLAGLRVLHTYCRITLGSGQCVNRAQMLYRRFGRVAIVFGRFALGVRAFLMPLAGSARLSYAQFVIFDAIGAFLWSSLFIMAGYALGNNAETVGARFHQGQVLMGSATALAFLVYLAVKLWKRRRYGAGLLDAEKP